jgi:hypothetical protein
MMEAAPEEAAAAEWAQYALNKANWKHQELN